MSLCQAVFHANVFFLPFYAYRIDSLLQVLCYLPLCDLRALVYTLEETTCFTAPRKVKLHTPLFCFVIQTIMAGPRSLIQPWNHQLFSPTFGNSGFFRDESLTGLSVQPFTYPVHEIFARGNFGEMDYDSPLPALRLASAFLTAGLPLFHTILTGKLEKIRDVDENGRPSY